MFSCSLPACSSDRKDAKRQKERERKKSLSKGKDRYTIVKGLAGGPDGISFESATKKKNFLRVRDNNILIVEPYDDSEEYRKQSTYIPLQDMWFCGYIVFESLVEPAHFIRRCSEQLILQKYENTPFFKEDASFKLSRKRCIACVKIGSRVWARIEKGCFLRGTVFAVDDMVHIQLENGNKVRHKKVATDSECSYVPDIVPHPLEIDVGTRVLARWFNRHDSYYPATIIAIRRNYFNVKYDDGDKGTNNINEIRILKQPEVEGGTNLPSWSSLDGLPRVGGLCIDSTSEQSTTEETLDSQDSQDSQTHERWLPYPRDISIPDRVYENHNDPAHGLERETDFGYENNLQYLSPPNIQPIQHAPVARNASQVSGGSADSGYHDNACAGSSRQRRTGLWADLHSKEKEYSQFGFDPRFLSPFPCNSNFNTSGERNLSELSDSSSIDSGYQGGYIRHDTCSHLRDPTKATVSPYNGRPISINKTNEKVSWEHEDTDLLSDNETSNSTNYSTTNELDFPDTFTVGNLPNFTPHHTADHATSHASHAKINGGVTNATTPTKSYGSDTTEDCSAANGSYVSQNGETANDTRGKTKDCKMFAENATKDKRGIVAKAVPQRHCPIHHHEVKSDRLENDTNRTKHNEYANNAILDGEIPRLIGLETVI